MKRKKIAAGNWKMNTNHEEAMQLATSVVKGIPLTDDIQVIIAPPAVHLQGVGSIIKHFSNIHLAAQNCHFADKGAYTGELSVDMLKSVGVTHVIIGHSERREYFKEKNDFLTQKVEAALKKKLTPIFCCGEPLAIRQKGKHVSYVKKQLNESLFHLKAKDFEKIIIAYEPIWAIGTGETATPEQAQDMHKAIRKMIEKKYSEKLANKISILYGGSVKPANAKALFSQKDVDGGLVGGASLKAKDFLEIIASF